MRRDDKTTVEQYLSLAKEDLQGVWGLANNKQADPRGRNAGKLLCQAVEHSLKALIVSEGTAPETGHRVAELYEMDLDQTLPDEFEELFYELDGLYTSLRYNPDEEIENLEGKAKVAKRFFDYASRCT